MGFSDLDYKDIIKLQKNDRDVIKDIIQGIEHKKPCASGGTHGEAKIYRYYVQNAIVRIKGRTRQPRICYKVRNSIILWHTNV